MSYYKERIPFPLNFHWRRFQPLTPFLFQRTSEILYHISIRVDIVEYMRLEGIVLRR